MKKAFIQLHIAVVLAGFTGVLGKLIRVNEGSLVWFRLLISSVTLLVLLLLWKKRVILPVRDALAVCGVGAVASLHWLSFYGSIKMSNVSIALVCFSAIGFFTAVLEPLFFRVRPNRAELGLGLMVIAGIYYIFQVDSGYRSGIIMGLVSALLGSIFPILSRSLLQRIPVQLVTLYELAGGWLFLSLTLPVYFSLTGQQMEWPGWQDWIWLLILSWACTVLAINLSMSALQKISAFTVNLTYNLEPVYGIFLAFLIFREDRHFGTGFFVGLAIILAAIGLQMTRIVRKKELATGPGTGK